MPAIRPAVVLHLLCDISQFAHAATLQLFSRFNGLSDVRLPPGRPGLAFVEYQTEELSAAALSALNGFEFDAGRRLKVSFAAK